MDPPKRKPDLGVVDGGQGENPEPEAANWDMVLWKAEQLRGHLGELLELKKNLLDRGMLGACDEIDLAQNLESSVLDLLHYLKNILPLLREEEKQEEHQLRRMKMQVDAIWDPNDTPDSKADDDPGDAD